MRVASILRVHRITKHLRCAHFAVADLDARQFHHGHSRALLTHAGADSDRYRVWLHDWSAELDGDSHRLRAQIRGAACDLRLTPAKPCVIHAESGAFKKSATQSCGYFAFTRMNVEGELAIGSESLPVTGEAWMDREYGPFTFEDELAGWDWFALQLDDRRELMVYLLRDKSGAYTTWSGGALVGADGSSERLSLGDLEVEQLEHWTSRETGNAYPVAWTIRIPRFSAQLLVRAQVRCCELDTRGSTSLIYWEGPVDVSGELQGAPASGRGFMELVGYESNSRRNGLYNFDTNNMPLSGWVANEARLRLFGSGRTLRD